MRNLICDVLCACLSIFSADDLTNKLHINVCELWRCDGFPRHHPLYVYRQNIISSCARKNGAELIRKSDWDSPTLVQL